MVSLALAMMALNEEHGLPLAVASVRSYVDEIVVGVDRRTTDGTREAVEEATVFDLDFVDFAQMRNDVLARVRSDWVLMLDADEILEGDPRPLLTRLPRPCIWEFPRRHWLDFARTRTAPEDDLYPDRQARLFPNDGSVRFERPVHEVAEGLRKKRSFDQVIHHFKRAMRDDALIAERDRLYLSLVERGLAVGYRFRKGKDY
ncbi:MAG: glycosyltransferase [Planctomycetota bacterium]|jgi:glycosyltransferase involved in cell wall biosynthesis